MPLTPQFGDSENNLIAKIAVNTGPNMPTKGDGRWNLLYKVTQNTYESAVSGAKVPPGGTTDQVLTKNSDNDFDLIWKSVGIGPQYIDGEVATYNDLPITLGTPPIDSAYLVREPSGVWLIGRHPAGVYIRTANNGVLADWTYAGILPDVFSDANFAIYNISDSSRQMKLDVSGVSAATTRTLVIPDANGTIKLSEEVRSDFVTDTSYIGLAPEGSAESANVWTIYRNIIDSDGNITSTTTATNVAWDDRYTATYT
jgi:hypothetical protein